MLNLTHDDFSVLYTMMLRQLVDAPRVSARGIPAREVMFAAYTLTDTTKTRINFERTAARERQEVYDRYAAAELEWYRSGRLQADSAPSKFWLKLADADGNIVSNYGHIVLHDRVYQMPAGDRLVTAEDHVVFELTKDPDSRRAIIHYSTPARLHNPKDMPCTVAAQLLIRDGLLHMMVFQRSADIIKGLSYDVVWHAWLMTQLARRLEVRTGHLCHTFGSLHLYESDLALAERILTHHA